MPCLVDKELPGMRTGSDPIPSQKDPIPKNPPNREKLDLPYLSEVPRLRPNGPHSQSLIRSVCSLQFDTVLRQAERTSYHLSSRQHRDLNHRSEEFQVPHSLTVTLCSQEILHRTGAHAQCCQGTWDLLRVQNNFLYWRCCCGIWAVCILAVWSTAL